MAHFSTQIRINATKEKVWEVLADVGGIYKWNPGVAHSYSTSEKNGGEGASRHCDLQSPGGKSIGYLEELAFDWREGEGYKIDIYESNLPIKSNVVEFAVNADRDGTIVTAAPDYALKYGLLGRLMNQIMVRRKFKKGMEDLLTGLKYHIETGEVVGDRVPDMAAAAD